MIRDEKQSNEIKRLHQKMSICRLCLEAGYDIFPRAIFSGSPGARIMIIGQAPGITEKEAGRPFNAGSGTRLFKWLSEAGLEEDWFRKTQYMTAVTKCYPGRSKSGNGDRVPSLNEQQLCRPFLDQEVALIRPSLIIPVGRLATNIFFQKNLSLSEIIGARKAQDGCWLIPLPHPSGASRWHQIEENRVRINKAILLIKETCQKIWDSP